MIYKASVDELNKHVGDTVTVTGTFDVISVKSDKTSNRYEFRVAARNEDGSYTPYASMTLNTAPKIGDKIMDEDGRVGQLSRIVPYRSPSERFMCATLSLTLFFHMEKKDGTYDNREVYVHGFPIKL